MQEKLIEIIENIEGEAEAFEFVDDDGLSTTKTVIDSEIIGDILIEQLDGKIKTEVEIIKLAGYDKAIKCLYNLMVGLDMLKTAGFVAKATPEDYLLLGCAYREAARSNCKTKEEKLLIKFANLNLEIWNLKMGDPKFDETSNERNVVYLEIMKVKIKH